MDKEQSARVNFHLLFLLAFQATSALEIDFGALASSLNCVPLHKRLDISQDEIHVGITVSSFEIPMKLTFFLIFIICTISSLFISLGSNTGI